MSWYRTSDVISFLSLILEGVCMYFLFIRLYTLVCESIVAGRLDLDV